jgi:hypothetical protein
MDFSPIFVPRNRMGDRSCMQVQFNEPTDIGKSQKGEKR